MWTKEYAAEYQRKWRKAHPQRRRELALKSYNKRALEIKIELIQILGGPKCSRCGFNTDIRALEFDHIQGHGNEDRQAYGVSSPMALRRIYVGNPKLAKQKLQILCANCNKIKKYERWEVTGKRRYGRNLFGTTPKGL